MTTNLRAERASRTRAEARHARELRRRVDAEREVARLRTLLEEQQETHETAPPRLMTPSVALLASSSDAQGGSWGPRRGTTDGEREIEDRDADADAGAVMSEQMEGTLDGIATTASSRSHGGSAEPRGTNVDRTSSVLGRAAGEHRKNPLCHKERA